MELSSSTHTKTKASRLPGVLAAGLLLLTVMLVLVSKIVSLKAPIDQAPVTWQKELLFADGPAGEVVVQDFQTKEVLARFEGEQGFVRGTLRALARERKRRDIGPEKPFELVARHDGRLTLYDPSTSQHIDLDSFGPSNVALFRNLHQVKATGG